MSNLTLIKAIFVVAFGDTWESYVYTYCTKAALKEMLLKRTITQKNSGLPPGWLYEIS